MNYGFTGTRNGMTPQQKETFRKTIEDGEVLNQGCCVGSDEDAAEITHEVNKDCSIFGFPGVGRGGDRSCRSQRAIELSEIVEEERTHFARNRNIVDRSAKLVATPWQMTPQESGGTWYTINYARKVGKPVTIIWPDGSIS